MQTKYEDSLFYIISSSSRCFNLLFEQFLKDLNLGLSATEHLALKIISDTNNCSMRDLARIILKDRANTGKLALGLEKKGLIKIELKEKNNRPSKILSLTKKGEEIYQIVMNSIEPILSKVCCEVSIESINNAKEILKNLKKSIENTIKVNI